MDLDLLANPFYQRALATAGFIGFANGFFSGIVVLRRNALSVSALSHTMLPGIALGIFITGALSQWNAFFGAMFAALLVGLGSVVAVLLSGTIGIAPGPAIVIVLGGLFVAAYLFSPKYGLLGARWR